MPVRLTTTTFLMLGHSATALSALVFMAMSFFLPRSAVSCVIRILHSESWMRSRSESSLNAPNTTEWIAPMRAQASMATGSWGIICMYRQTRSPFSTPSDFSALANLQTSACSSLYVICDLLARLVAFPDDGDLVATRLQVTIQRVDRQVGLAVDEPLDVDVRLQSCSRRLDPTSSPTQTCRRSRPRIHRDPRSTACTSPRTAQTTGNGPCRQTRASEELTWSHCRWTDCLASLAGSFGCSAGTAKKKRVRRKGSDCRPRTRSLYRTAILVGGQGGAGTRPPELAKTRALDPSQVFGWNEAGIPCNARRIGPPTQNPRL